MRNIEIACWGFLFLIPAMLSSCASTLTPELIEALAKDSASFCFTSDLRGGAGAGALAGAASGGYGQATLSFCRSNQKEAKVAISPDGTIFIKHGR